MIQGNGICFLFSCIYFFIAIGKVCQREQLSCLFQSPEESDPVDQALMKLNSQISCQIWRLSNKSHISMQDSYFVIGNKFDKERVKKSVNQLFDQDLFFNL